MTLEIIATSLTDVKQAEAYGADRLELCTGIAEGGITPNYGLIAEAVKAAAIPINVMIRPHSESFMYNEDDLTVMKKDIQMVRELGANGIVIGALTADDMIDEAVLKQLLDEAQGLDVTFHREFDFARNQEEALACLAGYPQVKRILTSAGQQPAPQAVQNMKQLMQLAGNTHLEIMAGHGLKADNFAKFYKETEPKEVHFGSGVREKGSFSYSIDERKMNDIKTVLRS
ncbi:copper homeostasis protein CutC [Lentibacillus amyloliquefaciens]|uniref:PF03932 family protein CutC n=1 Tax=Lentibacillus amyloliquefaciens TaxID=1472767 RepID=A0A0U4FSH4_9BACI|nr:copper homeostasis protein CutC [Lentibacillus amyloliquefaciens]ALX50676.1 copper homeostasis protein [Lentibacillus amyloliquefaciens]